jgi:AcrR family transcriptional regulator
MTSGRRAVVWSPLDRPGSEPPEAEGLRQRKKRLLRQQLSDTATQMFMERGFDDVRVSEVAEACQVSEKTVFNYFPTKESLILDRWDATMASLPAALADPEVSPVEATLRVLAGELGDMTSWLASQDDPIQAGEEMRRFDRLIWSTPSLRAYQRDMTDRLAAAAAGVLALARPVPEPDQVPGRRPHSRSGARGGQGRRAPRGSGHRHWTEHVHRRPGTDAVLRDHAACLLAERLDVHRPLWELTVVDGLSGGRVAVVNRCTTRWSTASRRWTWPRCCSTWTRSPRRPPGPSPGILGRRRTT